MRFLEGVGVLLEQQYPNEDAGLDAVEQFLLQQGHGRRRVQRAMLLDARAETAWWSDRLGLSHDCTQHSPSEATAATCDVDTRSVSIVLGLPQTLLVRAVASTNRREP